MCSSPQFYSLKLTLTTISIAEIRLTVVLEAESLILLAIVKFLASQTVVVGIIGLVSLSILKLGGINSWPLTTKVDVWGMNSLASSSNIQV
jgi:hypothetical protein